MEGLGAAASAVAVIELGAKVAALCLQYTLAVKNAKHEIERFRQQTEGLMAIADGAQRLLQGPDGARLQTAQNLRNALANARSRLDRIHTTLENKLNASRTGRAMRRMGWRALAWPFESKDTDKIITDLQRDRDAISAALQIDQTTHILDINRKADEILEINRTIDLVTLPVAKGAAFDAQANEHDPSCHPNTRVDLLADIQKWIEDPNGKCIFWLRGMAGTGKSTISRTVAKNLSDATVPSASFFFKKGEGDRGKADMFFTTILAQLVRQLPALALHVRHAIESDPTIVDKTKKEQFEKLFLGPLDKCKDAVPAQLVVVVDALDECDRDDDAIALIHLLSRAKEAMTVCPQFFITSRPELPIRLGFKDIDGDYRDLALHEVPRSDIKKDISMYLGSELTRVRQNFNKTVTGLGLPPDWPPSASLENLVDMAVPLFIFASTACRFIADSDYGDPKEQLDKILEYRKKGGWSQLHTTYLPILNQLLLKRTDSGLVKRTKDEEAAIVAWFQDIVGTIVLLADPLPSASLARVLGRSQLDVDAKLRRLHSVLEIPDNPIAPVRLLHLSFRDFLVDHENRDANPFWVDERETHERLADRCLELLLTDGTLKRDVCGLRWPGTLRSDISPQSIRAAVPPDVQYACRYWVYHWKESMRKIRDGDLVNRFLASHLLHWLEVLGIMGRIRESIGMINDLLGLLHPEDSTTVSGFLRDLRRFIPNNFASIDLSPLQVYSSAITFAPEKSAIRKMYGDQCLTWLSLVSQVDQDWNACLQTLEGHSSGVMSVTFSGDGRQLASTSNDKTIKLWDVQTGACVATFAGHSAGVSSVTFSRDGRQLASASWDKTVKLWDVQTGTCVTTFVGHDDDVNSVAFSGDGRQLASASDDKTIRFWDVQTGTCVATFTGHSAEVSSVTFSCNGRQLASASWDKIVKLWDVQTGTCVATFAGHRNRISSVAFSHDDCQLASASRDSTVKLWDVQTGVCVATFTGHGSWISAVAYSHDDRQLASASWDNTVKLWDVQAGVCVATYEGHSNHVNSVAFSGDGRQLASASNDRTVKLWDTQTGAYATTLTFVKHRSFVYLIAFSMDGRQLASASGDYTIKLWDVQTGVCVATLVGHTELVTSVAFSGDGRRLASASNDKTVKLWDAATGQPLQTLQGRGDISSLSFDAAGSCLFTDGGVINLGKASAVQSPPLPAAPQQPCSQGFGVSFDRTWITWGGRDLLWLPSEYRPCCSAVAGSTAALGCGSGRVLFFRFSEEVLFPLGGVGRQP